MTNGHKVTKAANCPLDLEICFPSCYWRSGNKCTYYSQRCQSQQRQTLTSGYMFDTSQSM